MFVLSVADLSSFKHVQWYYAFRLLKSTFFMAMGNASDASALENIRAVQSVANTRGDNAMSVFASLLEGMALLKSSRDGNIERVHACIAQAAKFQFDPTVKILQLDMLTLLLDFASSLHHLSPDTTAQKLRVLQQRLDECEEWHNVKADFLIPVKKQPSSAKTVSEETSAIIRPGSGSVDDGVEHDYMVMTFMTKMELRALVYVSFRPVAMSSQGSRLLTYRSTALLSADWRIYTNHLHRVVGPLNFGLKGLKFLRHVSYMYLYNRFKLLHADPTSHYRGRSDGGHPIRTIRVISNGRST